MAKLTLPPEVLEAFKAAGSLGGSRNTPKQQEARKRAKKGAGRPPKGKDEGKP
jgi:hypothetical protein